MKNFNWTFLKVIFFYLTVLDNLITQITKNFSNDHIVLLKMNTKNLFLKIHQLKKRQISNFVLPISALIKF